MKPGGLIRVQTAVLQPASQYKSLLIAEETTSDELLQLLLRSYKSNEPVERFSVYEVSADQEYQRKLHPDDAPLRAQMLRQQLGGKPCQFLVRENPQYLPQCRSGTANFLATDSANDIDDHRMLIVEEEDHTIGRESINAVTEIIKPTDATPEAQVLSTPLALTPPTSPKVLPAKPSSPVHIMSNRSSASLCNMCKYTFKTCDFCHKNTNTIGPSSLSATNATAALASMTTHRARTTQSGKFATSAALAYSPVYNIREIRTLRQSFSTPGGTKRSLTFGRPFALSETGAGGMAI